MIGFFCVFISDSFTEEFWLSIRPSLKICISKRLFFCGGAVMLKFICAAICAATPSLAPYLKDTSLLCWLIEITLRFENISCESSLFLMNFKLGPDTPPAELLGSKSLMAPEPPLSTWLAAASCERRRPYSSEPTIFLKLVRPSLSTPSTAKFVKKTDFAEPVFAGIVLIISLMGQLCWLGETD